MSGTLPPGVGSNFFLWDVVTATADNPDAIATGPGKHELIAATSGAELTGSTLGSAQNYFTFASPTQGATAEIMNFNPATDTWNHAGITSVAAGIESAGHLIPDEPGQAVTEAVTGGLEVIFQRDNGASNVFVFEDHPINGVMHHMTYADIWGGG